MPICDDRRMTAPTGSRPPSVEHVLAATRSRAGERDRDALVAAARATVEAERHRLRSGEQPRTLDALADAVLHRLDAHAAGAAPASVINATGVIVHTNLGRAPWPAAAVAAAEAAAREPLFLELDAVSGRRGRRYRAAEEHLVALTGAGDALVTNNGAAAVALAVALAGRRGVVVSRGELVEIGGGVRIPEIVRRAGARLVEVGTTNRTRVEDFEGPLADGRAAIVLRVHPSNFAMAGFVEAPDAVELAALAHAHGALVVDDLGSGALLDTAAFGMAHEPTPMERLAAGADLVAFSGDKLVGGPQAGLLVGRADLVARVRRDPLARAMRPDKATLAGVAATLGLYRAGLATAEIPVWRMIATPSEAIHARAEALATQLPDASVVALAATIGGGSLPGETLPSFGLALVARSAGRLLAALRSGVPAVVGRIEDDRVVLDLRTVDPGSDAALVGAVVQARSAVGRAG
jgi:L-seryl-tRNA(Ser) seleniumtransferase